MKLISYSTILCFLLSCNSGTNESQSEEMMTIYVGTYSQRGSEGIYSVNFNDETGEIGLRGLIAKTENPSYLALKSDGSLLVSVNELDNGQVSVFRNEGDKFIPIDQKATQGMHPCYVGFDKSETKLSVANYSSGSTSIFEILTTGELDLTSVILHDGQLGTDSVRQEKPHGHYAAFVNGEILSVDLGIDAILKIVDDSAVQVFKAEPGDGPRHIDKTPDGKFSFLVTELSNFIVSLSPNSDGSYAQLDRKTTLPEDFDGQSYSADIHVSPDGRFVYSSNRGHNSIAIFGIDDDGSLTYLGTESTKGKWPRNFVISPSGKWLIVANEHSDNITVFERDMESGLLKYTGNEIAVGAPTCLKF